MRRITETAIQEFETRHIDTVRELAPECVVLLKNDNMLPLANAGKIALFGSGARRTIKGGTGSGDVNVRHFVTIEEGLKNAGFEITSNAWLDAYDELIVNTRKAWVDDLKAQAKALNTNAFFLSMGKVMPEPEYDIPLDGDGNTAIYVLSRISGEGNDRQAVDGDINLSETEIRDILALNAKYEKFVLVLNVGGMVNLEPVSDVKAILLLGQLGTPTGDVCADILLGRSYPSGKLTMTWAPIDRYPSTEGFGDINDVRYNEGVYVGYRYFDTVGEKPFYPFGYGFGYTTFAVEAKDVTAAGGEVTVTASVTNTGDFAGKEVVQIYVSAPQGTLDKPYQELKGFQKTNEIAAGECEEATVTFPITSLTSFSEEKEAYVLEKGDYVIRVGNCSDNTVIAGILTLTEDVVTEEVKHVCGTPDFKDFVPQNTEEMDIPSDVKKITVDAADIPVTKAVYREDAKEIQGTEPVNWEDVISGRKTAEEYAASLSNEHLADLAMGNYDENGSLQSIIGAACTKIAGGAGETTQHLKNIGMNDVVTMADGPAGLRLSPTYKFTGEKIIDGGSTMAGMTEFMDEEEMRQMAAMMPQPTKEELEAPVNYQYCAAIPIGTDLAQSFNPVLCETMGDMVGEEMEIFGVNLWLAPALNIHRSPLCGRNFEYYSEDPLISGKIAAAITNGVQKHEHCGTTIKHFACNNQETNRYCNNSIVSERALREIYLKGFEIAVKESSPKAMMSSYNFINGEHACNSKDLLTYVLRDEWGYEGVVMTDWYVTTDMMRFPDAKYASASAAGCVKAGNHLTMPGTPSDKEDILNAVDNPLHPYPLTRAELQVNAVEVLKHIIAMRK